MTHIPMTAGRALAQDDWNSVRLKAMFDCCKWDVQSGDHCVLADFPLLLDGGAWSTLGNLAEALAAEALEAERELISRPDLHEELGLPSRIRQELRRRGSDNPSVGAARVMRFDFHFTQDGWRVSEVNADVPGGFIEASAFTGLMSAYFPEAVAPPDPASAYAEAMAKCAGQNSFVGFVHATAHIDDAQVMQFLANQFRALGMRTALLSPEHIAWDSGRARIASAFAAGNPDLLVRFFPAEWLPKLRPESTWSPWFCGGVTPMSNPGSAILIQSKRLPLVWDKLRQSLPAWRSLSPESRCPSVLNSGSEGEWVFKPIFGRVGEDVAIAGVTPDSAYKNILKEARRDTKNWVAQRRFDAVPLESPGGAVYPCVGVFTLDGRTVGAYGRIARKPLIDHDAQDIAILLTREAGSHND